jgi:hypothetical protein
MTFPQECRPRGPARQRALGGVDAIRKVQSETRHGEFEGHGVQGKATFIAYAKPLKTLNKITLSDGSQIVSGFDCSVSWSITPQGASIDKYELAGVVDFKGRRCYWMHGTTHWGKDNNQYYGIQTGCSPVTAFNRTIHPRRS